MIKKKIGVQRVIGINKRVNLSLSLTHFPHTFIKTQKNENNIQSEAFKKYLIKIKVSQLLMKLK